MTGHIHIDAIGGLSGDMFASAMLSTQPDLRRPLLDDLRDAGLLDLVTPQITDIRKGGFGAVQVNFAVATDAPPTNHWRDIREQLENSALSDAVKRTAIDIFEGLAVAEAQCHDIPVEKVHFHEVADWDSQADIVAAASLIVNSTVGSWSCSTLPLGRGRVKTQHGLIPIPAPATAHLLTGFQFTDDGVEGERITPTGAAILRHLAPTQNGPPSGATLIGAGAGAGQRDLPGIPNICRLLRFDLASAAVDMIGSIAFEIDDMTPEEIAVSLDHIRAHPGVLDADYTMGYGKKSRVRYRVVVQTQPALLDDVAALCLSETSTIGLRVEPLRRHILRRQGDQTGTLRTKTVARPGGTTTKVESDDLRDIATLAARRRAALEAIDD